MRHREEDIDAVDTETGVDRVGIVVLPYALALSLASENFDGANGTNVFQEIGVFLGLGLDLAQRLKTQVAIARDAVNDVERDRANHHASE